MHDREVGTVRPERGAAQLSVGRASGCQRRSEAVLGGERRHCLEPVFDDADEPQPGVRKGALGGGAGVVQVLDRIAPRRRDRNALGRHDLLQRTEPGRVARYEQALRERGRLLRAAITANRPADPVWLDALEQAMAEEGVAVAAARRELVQLLDGICSANEGPFPRVRLRLAGAVEDWLETMPALAAEDEFTATLAAARRGDSESGGAAIGPHRADFGAALATKGIDAGLASTGEQKMALIAILLAHAGLLHRTRGEPPLMLLDEVAAHLDTRHRVALFEALGEIGSQAWLSGTDAALFEPLRGCAQFLRVRDGTVASGDF